MAELCSFCWKSIFSKASGGNRDCSGTTRPIFFIFTRLVNKKVLSSEPGVLFKKI